MSDLHKILSKALNDPKFAATLKDKPEDALKQAGVYPTPEKVAALKDSVDALVKTHRSFGGPVPY